MLLQRFVKLDALNDKSGAQLLSVQLDNHPAEVCEFGTQTSGVLKKLKADKNPRLALLHKDMIQFLKRSSMYLQERLPLPNKFLLSVQCLKPSMRSNPDSIQMINTLAASVPHRAGLTMVPNVPWHRAPRATKKFFLSYLIVIYIGNQITDIYAIRYQENH